jgi:hypothetical protein
MNALPNAHALQAAPTARVPMVGVLRGLLISQAILTFALAIFFSALAAGLRNFIGPEAEVPVRFAAGGAFLFAVFAAIAARGARRRRRWSWTMAAVLQLILAIGTAVAVMVAEWHPVYLLGFTLAAVTMLVLSTTAVRRTLGQL